MRDVTQCLFSCKNMEFLVIHIDYSFLRVLFSSRKYPREEEYLRKRVLLSPLLSFPLERTACLGDLGEFACITSSSIWNLHE